MESPKNYTYQWFLGWRRFWPWRQPYLNSSVAVRRWRLSSKSADWEKYTCRTSRDCIFIFVILELWSSHFVLKFETRPYLVKQWQNLCLKVKFEKNKGTFFLQLLGGDNGWSWTLWRSAQVPWYFFFNFILHKCGR